MGVGGRAGGYFLDSFGVGSYFPKGRTLGFKHAVCGPVMGCLGGELGWWRGFECGLWTRLYFELYDPVPVT